MRRRSRPAEVTILCGMLAVGTLSCMLLLVWPLTADSPAGFYASQVLLGTALTTALWRARQVPAFVLHALVLLWITGITVAVLTSATPQGLTGTAFTYTWTLLYTSYFFTEHQARAYAALTTVVFLAACIARPFDGILAVFIIVMVTCVVGCELLIRMLRQLRRAALQDELTGQRNRAALVTQGAEAIRQARRRGQPLTVAVLDLDHFKQINDEQGHAAGDAVLQRVTREWSQQLRTGDTLYRSGGDEFVLLLPGATEAEATRLLRRLHDGSAMAWCFGLTEVEPEDDLDRALARADARLYDAKTARPRIPPPRVGQPRRVPGF